MNVLSSRQRYKKEFKGEGKTFLHSKTHKRSGCIQGIARNLVQSMLRLFMCEGRVREVEEDVIGDQI